MTRLAVNVKRGAEHKANVQLIKAGVETTYLRDERKDKRGKMREHASLSGKILVKYDDKPTAYDYHDAIRDKLLVFSFIGPKNEDNLPIGFITEEEYTRLLSNFDARGVAKYEQPKIWRPTLGESVRVGEYTGIVDWVKKNAVRVKISLLGRETLVYTSVKRCVPVVESESTQRLRSENIGSRRCRHSRRRYGSRENRLAA